VRVKDISVGQVGSEPERLTVVGSTLYFTADDGVTGRELWKTDGTEAGTVRVKDIRAGEYGADPRYLATFGSTLYFEADDGVAGRVPWKTDGSAGGTVPVEDPWVKVIASNAANFRAVGSMFYYTVEDTFWKTDGSEQGTVLVQAFAKEFPWSTTLSNLTAVGSTLYFTAYTTSAFRDPVGPVSELWKSDGTPDGTVRLGLAVDLRPHRRRLHAVLQGRRWRDGR
jgi:ELWxxDGT repeat protein